MSAEPWGCDAAPTPSLSDPGRRLMGVCRHIDDLTADDGRLGPPPSADGCEDCLAIGGRWVHLRRCVACGHVGCCDSSPNRHATAHHAATGHPVVQSFEPGEEWVWCYDHEIGDVIERLPPSPAHS